VRAGVVQRHRAVAKRLGRDELKLQRAGQPVLVQHRVVAGDLGVDEDLVLVDQIELVELARACRCRAIRRLGLRRRWRHVHRSGVMWCTRPMTPNEQAHAT
jgi:hypothetical protein